MKHFLFAAAIVASMSAGYALAQARSGDAGASGLPIVLAAQTTSGDARTSVFGFDIPRSKWFSSKPVPGAGCN